MPLTVYLGLARRNVFDLSFHFLIATLLALLVLNFDPSLPLEASPLLPLTRSEIPLPLIAITLAFFICARPKTPQEFINTLSACLIFPLAEATFETPCQKTISLLPTVFNERIAAIDKSLGFDPAFLMADFLVQNPSLIHLFKTLYAWVLLPVFVLAAAEAFYRKRNGLGAVPTFMVLSTIGFALYFLMPVVSPLPYYASGFPDALPDYSQPPYRNAMPSLHMAWVLMAFFSSAGLPRFVRACAGFFVVATFVSTLGLGEHYLTDLIVAFPLVLMVRALCASELRLLSQERLKPFLLGFALLLVWVLITRGALDLPNGLYPLLMLATVLLCSWRTPSRDGISSS